MPGWSSSASVPYARLRMIGQETVIPTASDTQKCIESIRERGKRNRKELVKRVLRALNILRCNLSDKRIKWLCASHGKRELYAD